MQFKAIILSLASVAALLISVPGASARTHHKAVHHKAHHHVAHHRVRHHARTPRAASYRADWPSSKLVTEGAQTPVWGDGAGTYWQGQRQETGRAGPVEGAAGDLIAEARKFLGSRNPTGFSGPWCGAMMALVARHTGHAVPTGYLRAVEWAHAGRRLSGPQVGAVAVMRHHVGIVEAVTARGPLLISGNHSHRVGEGVYAARRIIAYVRI